MRRNKIWTLITNYTVLNIIKNKNPKCVNRNVKTDPLYVERWRWFVDEVVLGWAWEDFSSVQFSSSVVSDFCNPMSCSTPGLPVHHQLLEFTQTHVHRVSDAIQPSHPLSSPSPPALNLFQHQGLFKWVSSLHQVAKVLEFQLQHQSFQWEDLGTQRWVLGRQNRAGKLLLGRVL